MAVSTAEACSVSCSDMLEFEGASVREQADSCGGLCVEFTFTCGEANFSADFAARAGASPESLSIPSAATAAAAKAAQNADSMVFIVFMLLLYHKPRPARLLR